MLNFLSDKLIDNIDQLMYFFCTLCFQALSCGDLIAFLGRVDLDPRLSGLVWTTMFVSLAIFITIPRQSKFLRLLIGSAIIRLIYSVGLEPTLIFLGSLNVSTLAHFVLVAMLKSLWQA